MLGPVMMAMKLDSESRNRSFGMKRAASRSVSLSTTGWRPATIRISPESENRGPRVTALGGHLGQRGGHVQLGDGGGGRADALGVRRREGAQLAEDAALQLQDLLLRLQDLALQFLELRAW